MHCIPTQVGTDWIGFFICSYTYYARSCCPMQETWQAMEECVDAGLTKNIGVSNFTVKKLTSLLEYAAKPVSVNQVG